MSDLVYISDTADFAIGQSAIIMNGAQGKSEWLNPKMQNPKPSSDEISSGVANWGSGNNLPDEMIADIEKTGVLSGALSAKARITAGKGPSPAILTGKTPDGQEILEFILDNEIEDWMEL